MPKGWLHNGSKRIQKTTYKKSTICHSIPFLIRTRLMNNCVHLRLNNNAISDHFWKKVFWRVMGWWEWRGRRGWQGRPKKEKEEEKVSPWREKPTTTRKDRATQPMDAGRLRWAKIETSTWASVVAFLAANCERDFPVHKKSCSPSSNYIQRNIFNMPEVD